MFYGVGPVVVDSLCIVAPNVYGGSVLSLCFVIQYFVPLYFRNHLVGEERAGCFTLITDYLIYCNTQCGKFKVCDCGIS